MSNLQLYSDCKNIPDTYCGPFNEEGHYQALFNRHKRAHDTTSVRIAYATTLERASLEEGTIFFVIHHDRQIIRADFTGENPVFRLSHGGYTVPGGYPTRTTYMRLRALTPARLAFKRGTLWCRTRMTRQDLVENGYPGWGDGPTELRPKAEPGRFDVEFVNRLLVDVDGYVIGADEP